jgi:hypothetical protein
MGGLRKWRKKRQKYKESKEERMRKENYSTDETDSEFL